MFYLSHMRSFDPNECKAMTSNVAVGDCENKGIGFSIFHVRRVGSGIKATENQQTFNCGFIKKLRGF